MVYGYARVSSKTQNLDREILGIKRFCEERHLPLEKIYADKFTGKSFDRPEYMKLRRKLKQGDYLVVHELDRFGRKKKIFWQSLHI